MIRRLLKRWRQSPADRLLRKLDQADRDALRAAALFHATMAEQIAFPYKDEPHKMPARNAIGVKKHGDWAVALRRIANRD